MAGRSQIEWTEATWNPVTGCTKASPGCQHCYAERLAKRLQGMGNPSYQSGFRLCLHERLVDWPLTQRTPRTIFVNSMSDLFHEGVPEPFIMRVFEVMATASWHRFQVLTKRSSRLLSMNPRIRWPANVWAGVSVENADYRYRIDDLRATDAQVRFLSIEPLLGPIADLDLSGINWVIVGGESGPGARAMQREWVTAIRDQCLAAHVPFFFKQWGGVRKKLAGRILDGRTWDQMPAAWAPTA